MRTKAKAAAQSRPGQVLTCVISLVLSYAFASRALDTGSYWEYLAALVAFVIFVKYLIRSLKK